MPAASPCRRTRDTARRPPDPPVQNDPLWKLRHALAGIAIALLLSVLIAALLGRVIGDLIADSYGLRAGIYSALLLYVVVGAVLLFVKVAQHETRPVSLQRILTWLMSLWLWPVLLLGRKR
jgi:MFS family permease